MENLENLENLENSTASLLHSRSAARLSDGNASRYLLIVVSFYGTFLCVIMLGYFRSKRRERRRTNVFTRLVHEEEQREWGAFPKKHSLSFPPAVSEARSVQVPLPFCGNHFGHLHCESALPSALACALCTEQSSVSSLCSSADTRLAIEEESDRTEESEEGGKGGAENSPEDSG